MFITSDLFEQVMKSIKNTQTEKNLLKAFAGESQARNRYTFFAKIAKKEGYEQIAALFLETAENEKEHAKLFFSYLEGGMAEITATYPAGKIGTTQENLLAAAQGEEEEWTVLYPEFGKVAMEEGFPLVANTFRLIAEIEKHHMERYKKLHANLTENKVFRKDDQIEWHCRECGHIHTGPEAPMVCPVCKHPQAYFERLAENY
jgi:rubrerythrin